MQSQMRASDADREQVVATLRDQVGTGRLTLEEFSERSARAYRSRTVGELAALTHDLPGPAPVVAPSLVPARPGVVPLVVLLVVALLLVGTWLAVAGLGASDSMTEMMSHMMGR